MIVLINTFKNMAVKFVGGCSVATRSYGLFILCLKFTVLLVCVVKPFQDLHDKRYITFIL